MKESILADQDKEGGGLGKVLDGNLNPTLLQQIRQLSVPMWARGLALALALGTALMAVWLLWSGARSCAFECNERLIDAGVKILSVAFVPLLVLVYLVFAETGVRALKRKTRELLEQTVVEALATEIPSESQSSVDGDVLGSTAKLLKLSGPTALYRFQVQRRDGSSSLRFQLDFNVSKVNVVVYLPWPGAEHGDELARVVKLRIRTTLEGAHHEGYDLDESIGLTEIQEERYAVMCGRKRLRADFLWDPASKLYFAQDLRFFLLSLVMEAGELCKEKGV